jgi:hypothetical protein
MEMMTVPSKQKGYVTDLTDACSKEWNPHIGYPATRLNGTPRDVLTAKRVKWGVAFPTLVAMAEQITIWTPGLWNT